MSAPELAHSDCCSGCACSRTSAVSRGSIQVPPPVYSALKLNGTVHEMSEASRCVGCEDERVKGLGEGSRS